jgi:hypothetical protein
MKKKEARAANDKVVEFSYTPLTDPVLAAKYAEALQDAYRNVVIRQDGNRLIVVASNRIH